MSQSEFIGSPQNSELDALLEQVEAAWKRHSKGSEQFQAAPTAGAIPDDPEIREAVGVHFRAGAPIDDLPLVLQACKQWLWLSSVSGIRIPMENYVQLYMKEVSR